MMIKNLEIYITIKKKVNFKQRKTQCIFITIKMPSFNE